MAGLAPVPRQQFSDVNGVPLAGAKIYFYESGTSTLLSAWQDGDLTVAHTNPAIADAGGFLTYYLSAAAYKIAVYSSADVLQYTVDPVAAVPATQPALDVEGTAGVGGFAVGDAVYLSEGFAVEAGLWYKMDADATYSSSEANSVGIAQTTAIAGQAGTIRVGGRVTGLSGLSPGILYYVSTTAGGITSAAPPNSRLIGQADTTTSMILAPAQRYPKRVASVSTTVGNVGTGEDTLVEYIAPAGELSATHMSWRGTFWGHTANNANAKTLQLRVIEGANDTIIAGASLTVSQAGSWALDFEIKRASGTAGRSMANIICGPAGAASTISTVSVLTPTITFANAVTIRLTGTATADNDITREGGTITLIP